MHNFEFEYWSLFQNLTFIQKNLKGINRNDFLILQICMLIQGVAEPSCVSSE
jgi:hypothetical protein